jgi:hypothetical protein
MIAGLWAQVRIQKIIVTNQRRGFMSIDEEETKRNLETRVLSGN